MKIKITFFQILLSSSLIIYSICKSKKKKNKKENNKTILPNGLPTPDSVRPNYVLPEVFCETCRAIVNEALKELRTKTKESDVYDYLSNVCDEGKYLTYEYIPKDIKRTCGVFMGIYNDEVVKLLTNRKIDIPNKDIISNFCDNYTQVCKGVEVNYEKSFNKVNKKTDLKIDGVPLSIDIHKDGEQQVKTENKESTKKNKNKKGKNKEKKKIKKNENKNDESDL